MTTAIVQSRHDANKAAIRRFHDATNSGDPELIAKTIDEVFAPDARIRTPLPIDASGAEAIKVVFATLLLGLPDLHVTIEDLIAEGDKVVSRKRLPVFTSASTWASPRPANASPTTRSSSCASPTAASLRRGA